MAKTKIKDPNFPYTTISGLKQSISKWRKEEKSNDEPLLLSGLALHLGVCKTTLRNWAGKNGDQNIPNSLSDKQTEELKDTMQKAFLICENYAEKQLYNSKYVTGAIFSLKSQFGHSEKDEKRADDPLGKLVVEVTNSESSGLVKEDKDKKNK